MRTALGFHFRNGNDNSDERQVVFDKVKPIVAQMFEFDDVFEVDSGHEPYNRAASRNMVVRRAQTLQADIVVIADADSIPQEQPLRASIEAAQDGRLHLPFDHVKVISSGKFRYKHNHYWNLRPSFKYGRSCGGIYVVRPEAWAFMGGQDERIVGWGYEDQICLVAANTFLDGPVFHPGTLYNINHVRYAHLDNEATASNEALRDRYHAAQNNMTEVRKVADGSSSFTGLSRPADDVCSYTGTA